MSYSMQDHALGKPDQEPAAILRKIPFQRSKNDIKTLAAHLAQCKGFFAGLSPQSLELLSGLVGYQHVAEGAMVCKQGRHGDSMYIVLRGYCSVLKEPAQPDGPASDQAAGSRRATAEQAPQSYASRRNTIEQPPLSGGSRRSTLEQVVLPFGSRRATAEQGPQAAKEPIEPPKHIGWVAQGEVINEAALVSVHRAHPNTVLAGDGGVELVTLDRSAFSRLEAQAGSQGSVAAAVQGIMAGCCRRVLQLPVQLRSADDVETLAELLRHLEAFKRLPANVCHRLAKGCTYSHMPAGALLFAEDSKADSMFVVVSGSCHVRARPLPQTDNATASSSTNGAHGDTSISGFSAVGGTAAPQSRRTTTDAILVGMPAGGMSARSSMAGAQVAGGAAVGRGEGGRRRTWEEGAYTEEEQQRLDAILEALKADQEKDQRGLLKHSNAAEKAEKQVTHDSLYWMARYMQGARTNANAQDPKWGMEGGMTPSGAIFAAKWRQTVRDKQAERLAQEKEQAEQEEAAAKVSGMEALLGKGAAKMLRQATADTDVAHTRQLDTGSAARAGGSTSGGSTAAYAAVAAASVVAPAVTDKLAGSGAQAFAAVVVAAMQAHKQEQQHGQQQQQHQQQQQRTQEQQQDQQQEEQEPADPNKLHMAALGAKDPANVSWALLAEIARRSQLSEVLADVAKQLTRKGLPRKLGQKACLRLTRELNKRILGGSSRQGLGLKADDVPEEGGQEEGQQWEVGTEATGLGDDWRSSLDGSETMSIASLDGYGERSMVTISGGSGTASPARYNSLPGAGACDALFQGAVQAHQIKAAAQQLTPAEAEARYGGIVRTVTAGQSIGELALLQRHATRTATLLVADDAGGADLIRISQSCFDATVRALQLAALEELLAFLGGLEPFRALSRDRLTSLAIFCRPVKAVQGEVVVSAGAPAEALYLVQEGEVQLLGSCLPTTSASGALAPSRRASMDQQAGGSQQGSGSRYLIRQLSASAMTPQGLPSAGRPRRMTYDPSDVAAPVSANQHQRNMASASAATLAAMGPGSVFGESVLGYADDAEAPTSRQAAAAWQLQQARPTHIATVVATKPCEMLVVPANALRRLASRIREPLMGLAASRRDFVQARIAQLQDTKATLAQAADGNRKELARNQRAAAQHLSPAAGLLPSIYNSQQPHQPHPLAAARLHAQQRQQQQQQQLPPSLAHKQDIYVSDVKQMTQLVPQTTVPLAEAILRKSSVLAAPAAASSISNAPSLLPPARTLSAGLPLPVVPYPIGAQAGLLPPPISSTAVVAERTGAMAPRPTSSSLYASAAFASKLGSVGSVGGSLPVSRAGSALPRSSGGGLGSSSTSARRSTGDKVVAGTNWLFQDALAAGGVVSAAGPLEGQGAGLGSSRGRSSSAGMQQQAQQQQEQYAGAQQWQAGSSGRLLHSARV